MKLIIITIALSFVMCFAAGANYQSTQSLKPEIAVAGVFRFTLLLIAKLNSESIDILDLESTFAGDLVNGD